MKPSLQRASKLCSMTTMNRLSLLVSRSRSAKVEAKGVVFCSCVGAPILDNCNDLAG